jgi:hypothetical protein
MQASTKQGGSMGYSVSRRRRLFPVLVLSLISAGFFITGCSDAPSASQAADASIKITTSPMYITVKNDSGMALNDIRVAIIPMGGMGRATMYTKLVGRMENSETRDIMLGEFGSQDGTPFNLRVARPKSVEVNATDVNGKAYAVEVGWQ